MEETNSLHRHGNKKKPITNELPSSKSYSEQILQYSVRQSQTGNAENDSKKSASWDRHFKSRSVSANSNNADNIINVREKRSETSVHKSNDKEYKRIDSEPKIQFQREKRSSDHRKSDMPTQKYATWDRNVQSKRKQHTHRSHTIDDSIVTKTTTNEWTQFENNKLSKLHRSKSTDISSLRHKSKSGSKSDIQTRPLFDDINKIIPADKQLSEVQYNSKPKTSSMSYQSMLPSSKNSADLSEFRSFPRHKNVRSVNSTRSSVYEIPPDIEDSSPRDEHFTDNLDTPGNHVSIDLASILPKSDELDSDFEFPTFEGYRRHGLKHSFPSAPFQRIKRFRNVNICSELLGILAFTFCAFLIFCPIVAALLVFFPISYLLKKLCSCCCYGNSCECGHLLTNTEKMWFDNSSSSVYQSVIFLEYGLSTTRIRDLIHARLVSACDKEGFKLYPKFTRKIQLSCKGPAWVQDHGFSMKNHVNNMPSSIESLEELQEYIAEMASKPLAVENPLWEIQVLNNFGDQRDTVILFRIHPCVYDGVSLVQILYKSLVDMETVTCAKPRLASKDRCLNLMKAIFAGPLLFFLKLLFVKQDFNMLHGHHVHLSGKKVISWSDSFAIEDTSRIRQVTRSALNNVLLSVASGCLRKYFCANGILHPFDLHTLIPVFFNSGHSVYPLDNNHFLFVPVLLPINTEGAIPRLWQMKQTMKTIHNQALFSLTRGAMSLTSSIFPLRLHYRIWNFIHNKCTCIISNVPGPEINLTFASRQIKSIIPWMPPVERVAVSVTFFTYGDQIRMSVMSDRSVLPNPELLTNEFTHQMQNLSELLANRRLPGEVLTQKLEALQHECEIHAEPTVEQIQTKMSMIQQEVQDLKIQLEAEGRHKFSEGETKLMRKIEGLKEQFRELVVEMRQRKAAESENAMILSDDDVDFDEDIDEGEPRRPFRRRTLSISSRMSTASVSSTARPLAAAVVPTDLPIDFDSISQTSSRPDGITPVGGRPQRRQHQDGFQILDYSYSPSLERRFRTF